MAAMACVTNCPGCIRRSINAPVFAVVGVVRLALHGLERRGRSGHFGDGGLPARAPARWRTFVFDERVRLVVPPSVSENPTLSLEVQGEGETELWLRDNTGNEFRAAL